MKEFQLYIELTAARQRAAELDRTAARLRNLADKSLPEELRRIDANWNGEASGRFLSKGEEMIVKLNTEAAAIQKCADTIRTIAKRTYDSEMKALEISRSRTYH